MNNTLTILSKVNNALSAAGIDSEVVDVYMESLLMQLSVDFTVMIEELLHQNIFSDTETELITQSDNIFELFQEFNANPQVTNKISNYYENEFFPMLVDDIKEMITDPTTAKRTLSELKNTIEQLESSY